MAAASQNSPPSSCARFQNSNTMVWFYCNSCGDSIKKPKLNNHMAQCYASTFTCIDCSATFDLHSVHSHTTCVTEKEKYVDGATKPGGFASKGYVNNESAPKPQQEEKTPDGLEFLSSRPPWQCKLCNVSCTSRPTLLAHASGMKHKKKVKNARNASGKSTADEPSSNANQQKKDTKHEKQEENGVAKHSETCGNNGAIETDGNVDDKKNGRKKSDESKKKRKLSGEDAKPNADTDLNVNGKRKDDCMTKKVKKVKNKDAKSVGESLNGNAEDGEEDGQVEVTPSNGGASVKSKVKNDDCLKVIKKCTKKGQGMVRISKLKKKLVKQLGLVEGCKTDKKLNKVLKKLAKMSKIELKGEDVRLVEA